MSNKIHMVGTKYPKIAKEFNTPIAAADLVNIKPTAKKLIIEENIPQEITPKKVGGINTHSYHNMGMLNTPFPINSNRPIKYNPTMIGREPIRQGPAIMGGMDLSTIGQSATMNGRGPIREGPMDRIGQVTKKVNPLIDQNVYGSNI